MSPELLIGLGALLMLTVVLLALVVFGAVVGTKALSVVRTFLASFKDAGISRDDGMIHIGAHVVDPDVDEEEEPEEVFSAERSREELS